MSLTNSNTYTEPTAGTSLNTARLLQNDSFRSLLSNFYSTAAPATVNFTVSGAGLAPPNGTLFRSATTGALYVADSINKKSSPVGGNFTRVGIGNRVEQNITALTTNRTTYEVGELVGTIDTGRLYLRTSNTDAIGSFIDVGAPLGYSVGTLNNVAFSGQSVTAVTFLATANVGINTPSPLAEFHVTGNAIIASNAAMRIPFGTNAQRPSAPATGMFRYNSNTAVSEIYNGTTWARLGSVNVSDDTATNETRYITFTNATAGEINNVTISSSKLYFNPSTGRVTATDFNSLSDIRVKSNVHTVDNALSKVLAIRGTYFDIQGTRSIGVIAQEIETVLPEVVTEGDYKTVSYGNIVGLLIEAIKELNSEVEALKKDKNKSLLTKIKEQFRLILTKE